jgi:hypothetical protein
VKEAGINAKQSGERGIGAKNIKKATKVVTVDSVDWYLLTLNLAGVFGEV